MIRTITSAMLAALLVGTVGCGGGNSVESAAIADAPAPAGGNEPPGSTSAPAVAYAEAESLFTFVTNVEIGPDGRPVVDFSVADKNNTAIIDVAADNVRFIIAKLQPSEIGNLHGSWQSYINRIENPGVGPGTLPGLQATAEQGAVGNLINNEDGTYRYTFAQGITDTDLLDPAVVAQAAIEGLDLGYDPDLTHRVSIQFGGGRVPANPSYDFQPSTGAVDQILRAQIVATESCNTCHEQLAIHGGGRVEMDYCVTCHNPGSTDANSGNSVAFDELIHKLHQGARLPSVAAGGEYSIYGFRDSLHDYSGLVYPQDTRNCTGCHAGSATWDGRAIATTNGDNWNEFPTRSACVACHDDVDMDSHFGGQPDDQQCRSCHSSQGVAGSPQQSHIDPVRVASGDYQFEILAISNTSPGEQPVVDFRIVNEENQPYDILNDAPFVQPRGASRIAVTFAWSTAEYTNTGNGADDSSSVSVDALTNAIDVGNGVFRVTSPVPIPDGSIAPFVAASGSGAVTIEGHPAEVLAGDVVRIPVTNALAHFSIDEVTGQPNARREIVTMAQCAACHDTLSLHGDNRTDNLEGCATCHNPRNTDRSVREVAFVPPTDGKREESLDFKTMIHAIHAPSLRSEPLQVVGFRGFATHVYDNQTVHYPGRLANCLACHVSGSYGVPLSDSVLGTTVDTGDDLQDPGDDVVVSPTSAVCASCHDSAASVAHMEGSGGDFATTQALIDGGTTVEQCSTCHGAGAVSDVKTAHGLDTE